MRKEKRIEKIQQHRWLRGALSILQQLFLIATVGSFFVFVPLQGRPPLGSRIQSFESFASSPMIDEGVIGESVSPTKNKSIQVFAFGRSAESEGPGGNSLIRK